MEEIQMGFFQDLKEDLSQAVTELVPDEKAEAVIDEKQAEDDLAEIEAMLKEKEGYLNMNIEKIINFVNTRTKYNISALLGMPNNDEHALLEAQRALKSLKTIIPHPPARIPASIAFRILNIPPKSLPPSIKFGGITYTSSSSCSCLLIFHSSSCLHSSLFCLVYEISGILCFPIYINI